MVTGNEAGEGGAVTPEAPLDVVTVHAREIGGAALCAVEQQPPAHTDRALQTAALRSGTDAFGTPSARNAAMIIEANEWSSGN